MVAQGLPLTRYRRAIETRSVILPFTRRVSLRSIGELAASHRHRCSERLERMVAEDCRDSGLTGVRG